MAQIVCISYIPWRSAPSRSQELLSHIPGGGGAVFPARVLPQSRRRSRPSGTAQYHRLPLPASLYLAEARPRTYRKALDFIQHCMDAHSFEEPLLWACTPMAANLMEELPCRGLVYDWRPDLAGASSELGVQPGLPG